MENYEIARAQYNRRDHRFDFQLSTRFDFDIKLTLDDKDDPAYQVTVTRKADGSQVAPSQFAHSLEDAHGLASEWWAQLSVADIPLDMGANR